MNWPRNSTSNDAVDSTSSTPKRNYFASLFQSENMMCGPIGNGLGSPATNTYGISTEELVKRVTEATNCGQGGTSWRSEEEDNNKNDMEAALTSLDLQHRHFEPHLCEDQEFFVINGSTSIDIESLSVPSMGDLNLQNGLGSFSGSDTSGSPQRRVYITSSPARSLGVGGTNREGAPRSPPHHHTLDPIFEDSLPSRAYPSSKAAIKKSLEQVESVCTNVRSIPSKTAPIATNKPGVVPPKTPPKPEPAPKETGASKQQPFIDEERLRELISPKTPKREEEIAATSQFLKEMQALVPSCTGPVADETKGKLFKPPEVLFKDTTNPADKQQLSDDADMKMFWKERFSQAATKVIETSSVRCMEIIDPTIPRASDAQRRPDHSSKGRRRYRKVLKKYRKHRILVLIMDPSTKLYEMLELPYRPDETTVADVLIMARIQTTDDRLRYQDYVGLCRPNLNPPPPPPPHQTENSSSRKNSSPPPKTPPQTPPRYPLLPPKVNRVTQHHGTTNRTSSKFGGVERREDDIHSISSDLTANTRNHSTTDANSNSGCMLQEITVQEDLVWDLLSPTIGPSGSSSSVGSSFCTSSSSLPSELTMALPYFTLPLLGDVVVTIPKGYTGEEVSRYALTILQTPLFLRWLQRRYLNDLQRDNDELLSRAEAAIERKGTATTSSSTIGSSANNSSLLSCPT